MCCGTLPVGCISQQAVEAQHVSSVKLHCHVCLIDQGVSIYSLQSGPEHPLGFVYGLFQRLSLHRMTNNKIHPTNDTGPQYTRCKKLDYKLHPGQKHAAAKLSCYPWCTGYFLLKLGFNLMLKVSDRLCAPGPPLSVSCLIHVVQLNS